MKYANGKLVLRYVDGDRLRMGRFTSVLELDKYSRKTTIFWRKLHNIIFHIYR